MAPRTPAPRASLREWVYTELTRASVDYQALAARAQQTANETERPDDVLYQEGKVLAYRTAADHTRNLARRLLNAAPDTMRDESEVRARLAVVKSIRRHAWQQLRRWAAPPPKWTDHMDSHLLTARINAADTEIPVLLWMLKRVPGHAWPLKPGEPHFYQQVKSK